jgi:hypothetical protein
VLDERTLSVARVVNPERFKQVDGAAAASVDLVHGQAALRACANAVV